MDLQTRITAFAQLGDYFKNFDALTIEKAHQHNQWFTPENTQLAITAWANQLTEENLNKWVANYSVTPTEMKKVGVIMASNIPLVGFHDMLTVLLSGHHALVKPGSDDEVLIKHVIEKLIELEPAFANRITLVDRLKDYDAVIATGSNNTARYFESYFKHKPNIIRKNRTSVAVLKGDETEDDFKALGLDITRYFGLGCRNVTKLFVPQDFKIPTFLDAIQIYDTMGNHNKYYNNYVYHKAIFLMNQTVFLDNLFLNVKEDENLHAPIGCLYYERYNDINEVKAKLGSHADDLQCVVAKNEVIDNAVAFGKSQEPALWDYADNVDTMEFLLRL